MRRAAFTIPAVPPSLNRLIRVRSLRYTEPAKWKLLVRVAARGIAPFDTPVRITFTFYGRIDADNGPKLPLDGLVACGLIQDDCYPFVDELVLRSRRGKPARTEIEIDALGALGVA